MLDDLFDGFFKGLFRFIWYFISDVVFGYIIKGPGYVIVRLYTKRQHFDSDAWQVWAWGIAFWLVFGALLVPELMTPSGFFAWLDSE